MNAGIIGQAVGLFAVTNIDDIVILALFFAQGAAARTDRDRPGHPRRGRRLRPRPWLGAGAALLASTFG
ncbi:hypothetical protein [Nonomuraea purpurea]